MTLLTLAGLGFVALGLTIGWYGVRPLAIVPNVLRVDIQDPNEVTDTGAFVVCSGVATASSDTVAAPFTGTRCLGFEFEVTERQPFGTGIPWFQAHLDDGVATRPFTLDGPTGTLHVVPASKRFSLDTESTVVTVGSTEAPPERIRRFVEVRDGLDPVAGWAKAIPGLGTRRYVERRIDPGKEYIVAGRTERRQSETVLAGDLVITDRSPRQFAIARLRTAAFPTLIAVIFVVVGVGGLVI